jgi:hypothetical protein
VREESNHGSEAAEPQVLSPLEGLRATLTPTLTLKPGSDRLPTGAGVLRPDP